MINCNKLKEDTKGPENVMSVVEFWGEGGPMHN